MLLDQMRGRGHQHVENFTTTGGSKDQWQQPVRAEISSTSSLLKSPATEASSFIHSLIPAISIAPLQVLYHSEALPTTARILYRVSRRSAQATAGKGLAQGPYVTARAGVEPTTLRLKVIVSTKAPPCP